MVSTSDLGPEGREFEPWPGHPSCVRGQSKEQWPIKYGVLFSVNTHFRDITETSQ